MSKQRKAFTLVELLVVIAIIGILFVVLISKVDFATEKSKATGVQTDFRSYQVAIETVARENAGLSVLVDNDATGEEKYADLEKALNKNLDPKLRVEIDADGKISTEAKDPWKEQYLGAYLAPDEDGTVKDRGAIVIYSKGSNLKLGTTAATENGVVNVTIESGKEPEGSDDYSISTIYTYVNGYGEIQTATGGFANNSQDVVVNTNNDESSTENNSGSSLTNDPIAGLYQTGALQLYRESGAEAIESMQISSWTDLVSNGDIIVNDGAIILGDGSLDDIPALNEYGFYYGTVYTDLLSGRLYKFYPDGSFELYKSDGTLQTSYPASTLTYSPNSIEGETLPYKKMTVMANGTRLVHDGIFLPAVLGSPTSLSGDLILPNDGSISAIEAYGLFCASNITGIEIPRSVTEIGMAAFALSGLFDVTLYGNSKLSIGSGAWFGCGNLKDVYYQGTLEQWLNITPTGGGYGITGVYETPCANIANLYLNGVPCTHLSIPATISEIRLAGFYGIANLERVSLQNGVTKIGSYAFGGCEKLSTINIPESVFSIGSHAFYQCTNLTDIDLPISITTIAAGTFAYSGLTSLPLHSSITTIDEEAFSYCDGLTSVVIPNTVTTIGEYAFSHCENVTSVSFDAESDLTSIPDGMFSYCTKLAMVQIPTNCEAIGNYAFQYCKALTSIGLPGSGASIELSDTVTTFGSCVFGNCTSLATIELPTNLLAVESSMFSGCKKLQTVTINASLQKLDLNTFHYNSAIQNVYYKGSLEQWCNIHMYKSYVNSGTPNIKNLYIQDQLVENLTIPDTIKSIGDYSFYGVSSLKTLSLSDNVKEIGVGTFMYCRNLSVLTIGSNSTLNAIGTNAFSFCYDLAALNLPKSLTSLGQTVFQSCTALTSISVDSENPRYSGVGNCLIDKESKTLLQGCVNSVIPADGSVECISTYAFYQLTNLTSITIPSSVISIAGFSGCKYLTRIYYQGTTEQWTSGAITFRDNWNYNTGNYTVYCTDGTVSKSGTITEMT